VIGVDPAATAEGYRTVPLLDRGAVRGLREHFDGLDLPAHHGFFATSDNGSRELARAVDQLLKRELSPRLEPLIPGYEPFLAAFISKGAGEGVVVDFHQDWTYTDERRHRAVICWIPLVDTSAANGTLRVLPGSHRWTTGLRASGAGHATDPLQDALGALADTVEVEAGTAFVYDPALVHGSFANPTDDVRPIAAIALAPRVAPLVHFHQDDRGSLGGWVIDESHYTTRPFGTRPAGDPTIEPWDRLVCIDDLVEHLVPAS